MLTVPTRRVVWAGLVAPKLTTPMKRAAAHNTWEPNVDCALNPVVELALWLYQQGRLKK